MSSPGDIVDLERRGWEALSSSPEQAKAFYGTVLADDVHMLLPGRLQLVGKAQALEMMGGPPWRTFEMSGVRLVSVSEAVQSLTYEVTAQREGAEPYRAMICSTYALRPGGWQLVIHQHTPG